jgi:integrase
MKRPTLEPVPGGFRVRLRIGSGQRLRVTIPLPDEKAAARRAEQLHDMARALVKAKQTAKARLVLTQAAEQRTEADFRSVAAVATELCAGTGRSAKHAKVVPTFRELGEAWTSGKLHKLYPDQVPLKDTAVDDASRLDRYTYPLIGSKPIDQVTLDDCEAIMRSIPESAQRSRRHIAGTIARVFRMAVYPCRYIAASPLPKGFLPRANSRKALTYLYPANDRALLACPAVPFGYRLLWGFLAREGMREGEALGLTWECVDLVRGMVRLDENKTDDPRAWALDPGVARAMRVYRERFEPNASGSDPVFIQRSKFGLAETFRLHLERAGIKAERPELFVTSASRQRIRVHDLRGTFVTLALANGRPESWVMARTGHRSSQMVNRYRRIAMSFTELNIGELTPLDQAIPELAQLALLGKVGLGLGQPDLNEGAKSMYSEAKNQASPTGFEPVLQP